MNNFNAGIALVRTSLTLPRTRHLSSSFLLSLTACLIVQLAQAQWYRLSPLDSIANYIPANHHLSGMPSADSVNKNGLDLGGNQVELLKKIEELTLYVIDMNQQLAEQKKQNTKALEEIKVLQSQLRKLPPPAPLTRPPTGS